MGRSILFGYRIENGKAAVCEEEAEQIRRAAEEYLSGKSFMEAAKAAGMERNANTIRKMFENPAYMGTDFFPAILDEKTFYAIAFERGRRINWMDRNFQSKKIPASVEIQTTFRVPRSIEKKYADPFMQAVYAYGLIESEVR